MAVSVTQVNERAAMRTANFPQQRLSWQNLVPQRVATLVPTEVDHSEISRVLNLSDNLYRISFLPQVLQWVALDYADDVCNQAAAMRLPFAKTCRKIREQTDIIKSYTKNTSIEQANEDNGIGIQEQFSKTISELRKELTEHIRYCKPTLPQEMLIFYVSVYMTQFAFRALFSYAFDCDLYMEKTCSTFGNRSVILPQNREIYKLLPQFLGKDAALVRQIDLDNFSNRLVRFIKTAEFL